MDTLAAVNRILQGIGEPPVTALDTGGSSIEAEAEQFLDDAAASAQAEDWVYNRDEDVDLEAPDIKLGITGSTGTFVVGETVTQSGSGATGTFGYIESGYMYVVAVSGTFAGSGTLTGGTSGATRTTTSTADVTESKIAFDSTWTLVRAHRVSGDVVEGTRVVPREGFLWDADNNTFSWDAGKTIRIDRLIAVDFDDLHLKMQEYIVAMAALDFQVYRKAGQVDDAFLRRKLSAARLAAVRWREQIGAVNLLDNAASHQLRGTRFRY